MFFRNIQCFLAKGMFSKLGFFGKDIESKGENVTHKCGPRILGFFDVLPNFSLITWGTEHYY